MLITISGAAGTGKSTLARALAEKLGLRYVCAGAMIREMAEERELDVISFGEYLKQHPELDKEVDERIVAAGQKGNAVLEGRLVAWILLQRDIPAYKILLQASPKVAARIVEREGGEVRDEIKKAEEREATNWKRYDELYGISQEDESWYDLVVKTDGMGIEEVMDLVGAKVEEGSSEK